MSFLAIGLGAALGAWLRWGLGLWLVNVHPKVTGDPALHAEISSSPYRAASIAELVDAWLPLTYAVNSLNQSLGQPNLYPFVLTPPAIQKLGFVHALIQSARGAAAAGKL